MNITALIISNNRISYLKENISSLIKYSFNIFIVINGFNKDTVDYLNTIKKNYSNIDFIVLQEKIKKSDARNLGISKINSDVIYFLDDDVFIEQDNIKILQNKFIEYPFIGVIGGPNLNPQNSSRFQKLTGLLLSTYFVSYKMSARYYQKGKDRFSDDTELILCNLAIKKDLFTKYNLKFNSILHYNEENLLIEQIKTHNAGILYCPNLVVYHHRRKSLKLFLEQVYNSGKGRGLMSIIMPSSIKLFFIFPTLFIIYLIFAFSNNITFLLLNIYLIITIYNVISLYFANKLKLLDITILFITTILAHLTYGFSFVFGIIQGILWKTKKNS